MRRLTIISHTEHYIDATQQVVGLASTVREIAHLLEIFDAIEHVAMLHEGEAPSNCLAYASERIVFTALPAVGGQSFASKLKIVSASGTILGIVKEALRRSDYFQFRAPTGIGVFVIPYLMVQSQYKGWFKYAGNWKQADAPLAYRFQRWLLKHQSRLVTINGRWEEEASHCQSFENPCLTQVELEEGTQVVADKAFKQGALELCFVGRLEKAKGLDLFLEALGLLSKKSKTALTHVHVVGTGADKDRYVERSQRLGVAVQFYDLMERGQLNEIYKRSHGIVLPSASEGFPKVIAEAMNYGCVPMVSKVSSIDQYVEDGRNGYLIPKLEAFILSELLARFLSLEEDRFRQLLYGKRSQLQQFSYAYYNAQLSKALDL